MRILNVALLGLIFAGPLCCAEDTSGPDTEASDQSDGDDADGEQSDGDDTDGDESDGGLDGDEGSDAGEDTTNTSDDSGAHEDAGANDDSVDSTQDLGADAARETASEVDASHDMVTSGDDDTNSNETNESTDSEDLEPLCQELIEFKKGKAIELGCSADDSVAVGRLCTYSGSCKGKLRDQLDCMQALDAEQWSCDTGDGHPVDNGGCETFEHEFFGCLQTEFKQEDPFGCTALAGANAELSQELGCTADTMVEFVCNQLNLRDLCLDAWNGFVACLDEVPDHAYECSDDEADILVPKDGVCADERAAYDACFAAL